MDIVLRKQDRLLIMHTFAAFDLCVALSDDQEKLEIYTDAQYAYGSIGKSVLFSFSSQFIIALNILHAFYHVL